MTYKISAYDKDHHQLWIGSTNPHIMVTDRKTIETLVEKRQAYRIIDGRKGERKLAIAYYTIDGDDGYRVYDVLPHGRRSGVRDLILMSMSPGSRVIGESDSTAPMILFGENGLPFVVSHDGVLLVGIKCVLAGDRKVWFYQYPWMDDRWRRFDSESSDPKPINVARVLARRVQAMSAWG